MEYNKETYELNIDLKNIVNAKMLKGYQNIKVKLEDTLGKYRVYKI
jgi:hypothetical protein